MGTVVRLKVPHDGDVDFASEVPTSRRGSATRGGLAQESKWTPDEAARAWWEMTLIKSTLEALCDLSQQALQEPAADGCPPAADLQSAFLALKSAADQLGSVCHAEVRALLLGNTESLSFAYDTIDPGYISVVSNAQSIRSITPDYRRLHLDNPEMTLLAGQILEGAIARFGDAITSLSMTLCPVGSLALDDAAAQFARDTAALTRLQILAQADKALCSQADAIPERVYSLLNHQSVH